MHLFSDPACKGLHAEHLKQKPVQSQMECAHPILSRSENSVSLEQLLHNFTKAFINILNITGVFSSSKLSKERREERFLQEPYLT